MSDLDGEVCVGDVADAIIDALPEVRSVPEAVAHIIALIRVGCSYARQLGLEQAAMEEILRHEFAGMPGPSELSSVLQ